MRPITGTLGRGDQELHASIVISKGTGRVWAALSDTSRMPLYTHHARAFEGYIEQL